MSTEPEGIGSWPRLRAVKSAGRPAIVFRGMTLTYDRLADRVDRLAAALEELGMRPGDRVGFLGDNHPSFIESLFATALLGAVFVPLNTRLAAAELAHMLGDSTPGVLIATQTLEPKADVACEGLPIQRVTVVEAGIGANRPLAADMISYEALIRAAPAGPRSHPLVSLTDRAIIVYTSGTTGRPKGAVLTHGNLTWNAINVLVDYDITGDDRALMISPLFHVAALGMGCLPIILKGAAVLLEERFDAGSALRTVELLRATTISGVPTTLQLMVDHPAWATTDISSLRLLTCGGSSVPDRVRDAYRAKGLAFSGGYGMTEASPGITVLPPSRAADRPTSVGLAHFFTRVRIRHLATGELADPGERGEIEAAGPNIFLEYWRRPDATSEAFAEDGWLRTGDIAYRDDQGYVTIVDRAKDMIISGGENIYSAEVEQALAALPGVTAAAVVGIPDERWGEVPHAVVTLSPGHDLDSATMVLELSKTLARYKVPKTLEILDALPRTASGKVRKDRLRARSAGGTSDSSP